MLCLAANSSISGMLVVGDPTADPVKWTLARSLAEINHCMTRGTDLHMIKLKALICGIDSASAAPTSTKVPPGRMSEI